MKYVATYRTSQQISPDDWETVTRALQLDDFTTIAEIRDWIYKTENVGEGRKQHFKLNFQITQLDDSEYKRL